MAEEEVLVVEAVAFLLLAEAAVFHPLGVEVQVVDAVKLLAQLVKDFRK